MPIKEVEPSVEYIVDDEGILLSILVKSSYDKEGVNFFTSEMFPFQLGFIKYNASYVSKSHTHNLLPEDTVIRQVQEVIFVISGIIELDFYGDTENVIQIIRLGQGDTCLFVSGGHRYRVVEECKVVTVKQGPYPGAEKAKNYIAK